MNIPRTPSYTKALHEDVLKETLENIHREELRYLNLCGLPITAKVSLDDDTGSSLAYLHLAGFLTQLILAPDFRAYYEMFIELKLADCFDLYQDVVVKKYKKDRQARILEVYVKTCERFERCETRVQRKRIFDRVLDNLFETNSQDASSLKLILDIILKNDETLREISVTSMSPFKLNYFLFQLKKCYPFDVKGAKSVHNPLTALLNQEVWGPVHRCFTEASVTNLAVALNHGYELKISPLQLQWYLKNILTRRGSSVYDENFCFWYNYFKAFEIHDNSKLFRRLFLTFQLLYVIMHKMDTKHRRCLRLIWKTIPDHYITAEELELITKELPVRKKMARCYEAFVSTGKYFEIKSYVNRPRDLKHYCRCHIRNCLMQNGKLPEGIAALQLPSILQSYMLLESSGISTSFVLC